MKSSRGAAEWARDAWLPVALAVVGVAEMMSLGVPRAPLGAALETLACGLLVLRRRHALVVAPLAGLVLLAITWAGVPMDQPSTPIAIIALLMYSLGRWVGDLRGLVGIAVVVAGVWATYAFVDTRSHSVSDVLFVAALAAPPYVLGRVTRRLAEQKQALIDHQELVRREAVRDERDRIARELHDVIAHSVSAMVVQVAAAQDLVRTDPDRTERLLADVAETGRRSLAETARLLHVIRDTANELGLAPVPGVAEVPALAETFREAGFTVQMDIDEPLPTLESGVDISAYRIVQEALTNAVRYAADRTVTLRLSGVDDGLRIHARNASDGATGQGSGLGLVGMAERVALLGGSLAHGVTDDGCFELDVVLPAGEATA